MPRFAIRSRAILQTIRQHLPREFSEQLMLTRLDRVEACPREGR
ncbi:hypothetical protein [Candidatus Laterigemmans baculatus]|nr:hypothetical protein [Candidatus Laterigemmans baculatus]